MSDKIQSQHVQRKAVLYVRQSSAYQVEHNLESQRLQYGMQERLRSLGWQDVEVISDADGVPSLNITGEALRILAERGADRVHVSISHTTEHAVAQVILEKS